MTVKIKLIFSYVFCVLKPQTQESKLNQMNLVWFVSYETFKCMCFLGTESFCSTFH